MYTAPSAKTSFISYILINILPYLISMLGIYARCVNFANSSNIPPEMQLCIELSTRLQLSAFL